MDRGSRGRARGLCGANAALEIVELERAL